MKEKELQSILYRDKSKVEAQQIYAKQIELLIDMVNYGTNLVVNAYDSRKKKDIESTVTIAVLLKHIVQMIDGVQVLISAGAVHAASLQARSAFEAYLSLLWILQDDSEKRAKFYYVSCARKTRDATQRLIRGTRENEQFQKIYDELKEFSRPIDWIVISDAAKDDLAKIDAFLQKPNIKEISDILKKKRGSRDYEIEWYKALDIKSIRDLAVKVKELPAYDLYYNRFSEVMHGSSYQDQIETKDGKVYLENIRDLKDAYNVLMLSCVVAIGSYKAIIQRYRNGELKQFGKKYITDWRVPFLNVPSVTYKRVE